MHEAACTARLARDPHSTMMKIMPWTPSSRRPRVQDDDDDTARGRSHRRSVSSTRSFVSRGLTLLGVRWGRSNASSPHGTTTMDSRGSYDVALLHGRIGEKSNHDLENSERARRTSVTRGPWRSRPETSHPCHRHKARTFLPPSSFLQTCCVHLSPSRILLTSCSSLLSS